LNTNCAECDGGISIPSDAILGEIVSCKDCGSEYEVAELNEGMAKLKPAEAAEEDWGE